MQTRFEPVQLAAPAIALANDILRSCVHCGFCMAMCPTYTLLQDERDSPRGRIYLIKELLESGGAAGEEVRFHVDRCLSCLSCMSACPSGVDYMHLVDIARTRIENTAKRSLPSRLLRKVLSMILPFPERFAAILKISRLAKPFSPLLRHMPWSRSLSVMLDLAPWKMEPPSDLKDGEVFRARGLRRARVILFQGCAQRVLAARINEAAIRLLTRHGVDVIIASNEGCCGALALHMGREEEARRFARSNVESWYRQVNQSGIDALISTASGCGSVIRDYSHILGRDEKFGGKAARISDITRDITEFLPALALDNPDHSAGLRVAWHPPCSLQHGQNIRRQPVQLLQNAGFEVCELADSHLCCGSAGVYNILQPELAGKLLKRKISTIAAVEPDIIVTANLGCMTQIETRARQPVVHIVELLDWATGGPRPKSLHHLKTQLLR